MRSPRTVKSSPPAAAAREACAAAQQGRASTNQPKKEEVRQPQPVRQAEGFLGSDSGVWMPRKMVPNLPMPPVPLPARTWVIFLIPVKPGNKGAVDWKFAPASLNSYAEILTPKMKV